MLEVIYCGALRGKLSRGQSGVVGYEKHAC